MPGEREYDDVLGVFAMPGNTVASRPGFAGDSSVGLAADVLRRAEVEAEAIRGELPLLQVTLKFEIAQAQEKSRAAQAQLDSLHGRFGEADARLREAHLLFEQAQTRLDGAAADAQVLVREAVVQASTLRSDAERASDQLLTDAKQEAQDIVDEARANADRFAGQAERTVADAARAMPADHDVATPVDGSRFADLGERVGQILTLADQEAAQLRADAERWVEASRVAAEREAAHVVTTAHRDADKIIAEAVHWADARRAEGDALVEHQRARVAEADADFERTLVQRREMAESEMRERSAAAARQLAAAQQDVARLQEQLEHTADEAARTRSDAERHALNVVAEATEQAQRIRAESDRELTVATRARDDIEAQLANVRQMLRTLAGSPEEPGPGVAEVDDARWSEPPAGRHAARPAPPSVNAY